MRYKSPIYSPTELKEERVQSSFEFNATNFLSYIQVSKVHLDRKCKTFCNVNTKMDHAPCTCKLDLEVKITAILADLT